MALEGNEFEKKIGDYGAAIVDLDDKGMLTVSVGVKVDLLAEVEKLAAKTKTTIDDAAIAWLKGLVGRA